MSIPPCRWQWRKRLSQDEFSPMFPTVVSFFFVFAFLMETFAGKRAG
jgi:hypothetical protein